MATKKKALCVTSFDHVPGARVVDRAEFLEWLDKLEKKLMSYAGTSDITLFTDYTAGRYTVFDLQEVPDISLAELPF